MHATCECDEGQGAACAVTRAIHAPHGSPGPGQGVLPYAAGSPQLQRRVQESVPVDLRPDASRVPAHAEADLAAAHRSQPHWQRKLR
eukprot:scaffold46048_cov27-Tisochrysis_lutea.AAC.1